MAREWQAFIFISDTFCQWTEGWLLRRMASLYFHFESVLADVVPDVLSAGGELTAAAQDAYKKRGLLQKVLP
ncbi:MAG: hypothetical protein ABFC31_03190 [Clostridiaceae bacterium]